MDRADPRASEHRIGCLGDHRQIDRDRVALRDAMAFKDVGETANLVVQVLVGDMFRFLRVIAFPNDRGVVCEPGEMPVDAVLRDIGGSVLEPFDRDEVRPEGRIFHAREGFDPIDAARLLGPEGIRIGDRPSVEFRIFRIVDSGALLPAGRDRINLIGHYRLLPARRFFGFRPSFKRNDGPSGA